MPKVNCTVNTCEYWDDGQVCRADEIWVKNDISGDPKQFANHFINANMEVGSEINPSSHGKKEKNITSAKTSPQTCCDTMKPKSQS